MSSKIYSLMKLIYGDQMNYFDHKKLDVYQAAIEFVVLINAVIENFPRGRAYLADQ